MLCQRVCCGAVEDAIPCFGFSRKTFKVPARPCKGLVVSITMCCCQGGSGVNAPTTSSQGTARITRSDAAASAVVTAVTPAPKVCTVSPQVRGPRLLLMLIVWPTCRAWRAKAWATRPAPRMPMSMVLSFLLCTCAYHDLGLPWSRTRRDGCVDVLPIGVAAPLGH